jgi:hypothetical protein
MNCDRSFFKPFGIFRSNIFWHGILKIMELFNRHVLKLPLCITVSFAVCLFMVLLDRYFTTAHTGSRFFKFQYTTQFILLALPTTKAMDIEFRFIIEYSSFRDFYRRPLGNNRSIFIWEFLKDDVFGLCWNWRLVLELWYLEGFWFLLGDVFEDYIFAWWNIWVSIILLLPS